MSLVPTYVLFDDGKWYKDPCIQPEDFSWYICFDDDDPIELVIEMPKDEHSDEVARAKAKEILKLFQGARIEPRVEPSYSLRCFGLRGQKLRNAAAFWIHLENPPPASMIRPLKQGCDKLPRGECVFCNFGRPIERTI